MAFLHVLGVYGSLPRGYGGTSSFLLGEERVLIDCGPTTPVALEKIGVDPITIENLLVTHLHGDHTLGIPLLLLEMVMRGRKGKISIYGSDITLNSVSSIIRNSFPSILDKTDLSLEFVPIAPGERFVVNQLEIRTAQADHCPGALGYQITTTNWKICFSGDTRPSQNIIKLAENVDILVHEATFNKEKEKLAETSGHSTASQAGIVASKAKVKRLVLTHFEPLSRVDTETMIREAGSTFKGEIIVPKEFERIKIY